MLAAVLAIACAVIPASASGHGWYGGLGSGPIVVALSCPSESLCVGSNDRGRILRSLDPAAPEPTWTPQPVPAMGGSLSEIVCASSAFCFALNANDKAFTTTEPGAPSPAWSPETTIYRGNLPSAWDGGDQATSCPSSSLCVTVTGAAATISIDPTASPPAWSATTIDPKPQTENSEGGGLTGVSCPSTSLCVAVDSAGRVVRTTDPAATTPTWSPPEAIDDAPLEGLSCPSNDYCIAIDSAGRAIVSSDPGARKPSWATDTLQSNAHLAAVSCPSVELCVIAGHYTTLAGGAFILATADPTAPTPAWVITGSGFDEEGNAAGQGPLLTCASASFCVLAGENTALISHDPAAASSWVTHKITNQLPDGTPSISTPPRVAGPSVTFAFRCSAPEFAQECAGAATITTTERLGRNGRTVMAVGVAARSPRHRTVVLGRSEFHANGGALPQTLTVTLNATGRRLLARFKRLPATLTITATKPGEEDQSAMAPLTSTQITFRAPHLKRSRRRSSVRLAMVSQRSVSGLAVPHA